MKNRTSIGGDKGDLSKCLQMIQNYYHIKLKSNKKKQQQQSIDIFM